SSPLIYEGQVYVLPRNGGIVIAFDAQTGKVNYRERVRGVRAFWASPWASGGEVFLPGDLRKVVAIAPGPEYKSLRVNDIRGRLWSTPAVSNGSLVLRYEGRLISVR
ncbi:MAG: hypothetical protein KDA37_18420, partial [Planctomycetales bacterium]|nr:hypothetical protein [Planctomycetales bacterium]